MTRHLTFLFVFLMQVACSHNYHLSKNNNLQVYTFRRDYSNVHLVKIAEQAYFMIDSGSWDEAPDLVADMQAQGIQTAWIKAILLTHGHWDHASGAKYFQEKFSIPVLAGAGDRRILAAGHADPLCSTSLIAQILEHGNQRKRFEAPKVNIWIDQKTDLSTLIGVPGSVLLIPTHTEGSLVVIMGSVAFMGDIVRGSMISSAAATHFYLCDVEANRKAVQSFLQKDGKNVQEFFPGHFGPSISRESMLEHFEERG